MKVKLVAKSAIEKFKTTHPPYVQVLKKAMPWAPAGAKMVISSPAEIDAIVRRIPKGKILRFEDLRKIISRKHHADVTCPLTTGIFLNIASAAAEEEKAAGKEKTLSWWRVLKANDVLNPKAPGGVEAHKKFLEAEGVKVVKKPRSNKLIVCNADQYAVARSRLM